ncbi:MAG: NUDIX hydrolase [Chloroflexota bacterium]|nr:MAG: DNA mismatch repair protein MutT [Chloroflexota bacterium]
MERTANYCPRCGTPLENRLRYGRLRPVCSACGHTVFFDPKVAVVVFVVADDSVLLVKRANEPGKGLWALPAGFVDADEDPREAAAREAKEETGLSIEIDELLDVLHRPDKSGLADIVIAYSGRVTGGKLHAADDAEAAGWFARDELPEIGLATTALLIERWLNSAD